MPYDGIDDFLRLMWLNMTRRCFYSLKSFLLTRVTFLFSALTFPPPSCKHPAGPPYPKNMISFSSMSRLAFWRRFDTLSIRWWDPSISCLALCSEIWWRNCKKINSCGGTCWCNAISKGVSLQFNWMESRLYGWECQGCAGYKRWCVAFIVVFSRLVCAFWSRQ